MSALLLLLHPFGDGVVVLPWKLVAVPPGVVIITVQLI